MRWYQILCFINKSYCRSKEFMTSIDPLPCTLLILKKKKKRWEHTNSPTNNSYRTSTPVHRWGSCDSRHISRYGAYDRCCDTLSRPICTETRNWSKLATARRSPSVLTSRPVMYQRTLCIRSTTTPMVMRMEHDMGLVIDRTWRGACCVYGKKCVTWKYDWGIL